MATLIQHALARAVWGLSRRQHGVVAHWQLVELLATAAWIRHRLQNGRLHRIYEGVYAVGRPTLTQEGLWMAAALACGRAACLSHETAAQLWGIRPRRGGAIHVTLRASSHRRRRGIEIHRRPNLPDADVTHHLGIPLTSPARTLLDLACSLPKGQLERAVNEADKLDLVDPDSLRAWLDDRSGERGVRILRELLDRHTYVMTDSELEQRFVQIARRAGLPKPLTQHWVNGCRVDFYWPDLGLVVETDGLRYHRTPAQQTADRRRDQAHVAAGLTPVRFSRAQVRFDAEAVEQTLVDIAARLRSRGRASVTWG